MIKCIVLLLIASTTVVVIEARSASSDVNKLSISGDGFTPTITTTQTSTENDENNNYVLPKSSSQSVFSSIWSDFDFVYKTYQKCSNSDLSVCLKVKLVNALDTASRSMKNIELIDGVKFVSQGDNSAENSVLPPLSEDELFQMLPRSIEGKENTLSTLIWDKISSFFQSHTLQIKFPTPDEINRSMAESRKDKKDKGGFVMIPLLLGSTIIPIAYGALALLAGKALIVSKLALVLASIIGIKKLVSHSGSGHETSREAVVSADGSDGWARKFNNDLPYTPIRR